MRIKRYMAAHTHLDGYTFLPLYSRCRAGMCGRRACEMMLSPEGEIIRF